jgi:hypothetical protein
MCHSQQGHHGHSHSHHGTGGKRTGGGAVISTWQTARGHAVIDGAYEASLWGQRRLNAMYFALGVIVTICIMIAAFAFYEDETQAE